MTVKEKLENLLRETGMGKTESAFVADSLIAHGVTIREQGEWATDTEDIKWGNSLKKKYCTVCGKRPHFDKEKREFILSDFCPNCGNPMKGESNA